MYDVLTVRNLTTELKLDGKVHKVIDNLSFDLKEGMTLALVGESGSGKSMTALSIMGILPKPPALAPQGEILFMGKNLLKLTEKEMGKIRGAKIAIIFQDPSRAFNPVYTIGEQIKEVVEKHLNITGKAAEALVLESLKEVCLPDPQKKMLQYPHEMSGGTLQRAAIAMAIVANPKVLIADEPTTALDVTTQREILATLKRLQVKKAMAILLITHDMGVVAEIADHVVVMYASQKMEEGAVCDIFDNPSHPYTKALFSIRSGAATKGKLPAIKGSLPSLGEVSKGCLFTPRCPLAMLSCKEQDVGVYSLKEEGHSARCHLFDPDLQDKWEEELFNA